MTTRRLVPRSLFLARRTWLRLRKPTTMGVRLFVRDDSGGVLLVHHTYIPGWHFPGGGVDRGESLHAAAARELREEVGLRTTAPVRLVSTHARFGAWGHDYVTLFAADRWEGTLAHDRFEIAAARFFRPDELPEDLSRATRRRLGELLWGENVREEW